MSDSGSNIGAIVGGVVGAILGTLLIAGIVAIVAYYVVYRRSKYPPRIASSTARRSATINDVHQAVFCRIHCYKVNNTSESLDSVTSGTDNIPAN